MNCPFCQNPLEKGISECPFCGKVVNVFAVKKTKWYHSTTSLIAGFLLVGPFILPAVWINPRFSKKTKMIITLLCLFITYLMTKFFIKSVQTISEYYGQTLQNY